MALLDDIFGTTSGGLNVAGGTDIAQLALLSQELALSNELGRRNFGGGLLETLLGVQQNPFSIVPALQAFQASGGGTLGSAASLAASGGAGQPSQFGGLVDKLLADLGGFATGEGGPLNPATGEPFSPNEMNAAAISQSGAVALQTSAQEDFNTILGLQKPTSTSGKKKSTTLSPSPQSRFRFAGRGSELIGGL